MTVRIRHNRPRSRPGRRAFTLIETMIVVLILALLASLAFISFRKPLHRARAAEAIEQIKYLDASSRDFARRFGRSVELVFDLENGTIARRQSPSHVQMFESSLAAPIRIDAVRTAAGRTEDGEAAIAVSSLGVSGSYAVRLVAPEGVRWIMVSGLGGEVRTYANDAEIEQIFAQIAPQPTTPSRHDAD